MDANGAVDLAVKLGASHAEVRVETVDENRIHIQDGELQGLVSGTETGFGVRVLCGGAWGFASSNDLSGPSWRQAVEHAVQLARRAATTRKDPVRLADVPVLTGSTDWLPRIDPANVPVEEKMALLATMDKAVRSHTGVANVETSYSDARLRKHLVSSSGTDVSWSLVRTVAQAHFTAKRDGHLAGRSTRVGGTKGWELFTDEDPVEKATKAAASTVAALGAPAAKGGRTTVVIDSELTGVFSHEAVGHASEADLVAAGESCFRGRLGTRLGVEGLTIRDDSLVPGGFGSFPYDDNGVVGARKTILEDGVLVGYLCDREHAAGLGVAANGAARAQDFHSRPLVRMSNTLMDAGKVPEEEVFASVKSGIYCKGSRGGQVDTARGTFLFNAQEAYAIENGEVTTPLRDVSLTGDILSTLQNITALGNVQRMGDPGYCGKGQWVPVCDGGPIVRLRDCLVGGGRLMPIASPVRPTLPTGDELLGRCQRIVAMALARKADQAEAYWEAQADLGVEIENGKVSNTGGGRSQGGSVRVVVGGKPGFAYLTQETDAAAAIDRALRNARAMPATSYSLPSGRPLAPSRGGWDDEVAQLDDARAGAWAVELVAGAAEACPAGVVTGGGASLASDVWALASSQGAAVHDRSTVASAGASVVLQDGERSVSASESLEARTTRLDARAVGRKAGETTQALRNPAPAGKAGRYSIVLEPEVAHELVAGLAVGAVVGDDAMRGKTVWSGKLGTAVANPALTLHDDPTTNFGLPAGPSDGEGLAARRIPILEAGVLHTYLFDSWNGHRHGKPSTHSGVRSGFKSRPDTGTLNLVLSGAHPRPPDSLVADVDNGFLVDSVLGAHTANATTGEFSVTAPNVWRIKGGKLDGAVQEIAIAGSLDEVVKRVRSVSGPVKWGDGFVMPRVLLDDMAVSM